MQHQYAGIHTAIPTPFDEQGMLSLAPLTAHIKHLAAAGADGVVPLGGTGEYTALSADDRLRVVEAALAAAPDDLVVMPGILHPGISDAIATGRQFTRAGAKVLMVVTPYYFRPTQAGIIDYYKRFSDQVDADIVLYEIPYRTGVSLSPDTIATLAEQTRTVGMKACNLSLSTQMQVAEIVKDKIAILSGEEDVFPLHVAMGAVGGILSSSNIFTQRWREIFDLARTGELSKAMQLHTELRPAIDALFSEPNPAPVKAAMTLLGWPMGGTLPPLRAASDECLARLKETVLPLYAALST